MDCDDDDTLVLLEDRRILYRLSTIRTHA